MAEEHVDTCFRVFSYSLWLFAGYLLYLVSDPLYKRSKVLSLIVFATYLILLSVATISGSYVADHNIVNIATRLDGLMNGAVIPVIFSSIEKLSKLVVILKRYASYPLI